MVIEVVRGDVGIDRSVGLVSAELMELPDVVSLVSG